YRAAMDPENGFLLSFFGFTLGVGFCEEATKALPLLWHFRKTGGLDFRGACMWGLASGIGFGVAEGVMYSSDFYNGVHGPEMYIVRFVSCVALHAVWSASVALTIHARQSDFQNARRWFEYLAALLRSAVVPMILHGLYDTLLKKGASAAALGV